MPIPPMLKGRLTLPVIAAPLFIVSVPELVIAACKAGVVGAFPALNARPREQLEPWVVRIKSELADYAEAHPGEPVAPFAVNQIVHASNERLAHDVEVCVRHKVPVTITSVGQPGEVVKAVHDYGGIVLHDVISVRHAEKAVEQGVDGLILVCAGAGGHAGTISPFALLSEVRRFWDGPVVLSGAITNGRSIAAAQALGADLAYLGTRFVATQEANTAPAYRQMLIEATAKDILYTPYFSGIYGSYLRQSVAAAGFDPDNLPTGSRRKIGVAISDGPATDVKAWRDVWSAGQGVGSVDDIPTVAECVARLKREYSAALAEFDRARFAID